jgi:transcriptional regulator with XRE-family HTH domain
MTRKRKTEKPVDPEVCERLTLLRRVLGKTTTEMCRMIGSSSGGSAWTNYEMVRRNIELTHALALCDAAGVTLDWIYRGLVSSELPGRLLKDVLAHADEPMKTEALTIPIDKKLKAEVRSLTSLIEKLLTDYLKEKMIPAVRAKSRAPRRRKRWPYLQRFKDRQGNPRFYVRDMPSGRRVALKGPMGTPEFLDAYKAALADLGLPYVISPFDDPLSGPPKP